MLTAPDGKTGKLRDKPAATAVWIILVSVAVVALMVLATVWLLARPSKDTLWYEVAKTCLQIVGVVVIGGIVSIAASAWQEGQKRVAEGVQSQRQADAARLERKREQFDLRTSLLQRSSRCAQTMFVTCQHLDRVQADDSERPDGASEPTYDKELRRLHEAYLAFLAEGSALQTELGARYGILWTDDDGQDSAGGAFLRWHQILDLLVAYYFNLCGDFRQDVLKSNSKSNTGLHSGLDLESMVAHPRQPTVNELRGMRDKIRPAFSAAMPKLANAILEGTLRDS